MLKVKNVAFIFLFITIFQFSFSQENLDEGLYFSSHEVNQDKRTSLKLTPYKPIKVKDKISLEFYANFRRGDGYYGNIFKIIGNESINIDFVGNLSANKDNFWLSVNNEILFSYDWDNIPKGNYNTWIKFKLELDFKNAKVIFWANSYKLTKKFNQISKINSLEIEYGKSTYKSYSTSDVCPMSIKNIRIFDENNNMTRYWPLGMHTKDNVVFDEVNKNKAIAINPIWLIDQHAFWKNYKNITFNNLLGIAVDKYKERFFFVEPDKLIIYNQKDSSLETLKYNNYKLQCQSNAFFYDNLKKELIAYSIDKDIYKTFDFINLVWSSTNTLDCKETAYLHHNKIVNPKDSTLLTFGGYGYYTYKSELNVFDKNTKKIKKHNLNNKITPRYLSSIGKLDENTFLIFGGYGSSSGKQGVGGKVYKDLYSVDFKDYSVKKIWELRDNSSTPFVPVQSMVVDKNSNSFYTLIYNNSQYNTSLKLAKFNISDGNFEVFPDSIPYKFLDVKSDVKFFLNSKKTKLNTIVSNDNKVSLYSLSYPPLQSSEIYQESIAPNFFNVKWIQYTIILLVIVISILVVLKLIKLKERKNVKLVDEKVEISEEAPNDLVQHKTIQKKSAIYLFGGFQVYDSDGEDITGSFTPTLKQLFLIILLSSSKKRKGISSAKLTDLLWPNKSENNARNNRNVNISKLRILISKIGEDIELSNENTYWKIKFGDTIFCDYLFVQNTLIEKEKKELTKDEIIEILDLVSNGEISPDEHNEWIDEFKENITNVLTDDLIKLSSYIDSSKLLLKLGNIILKYAPLNEEAIKIKCKALYKLGRRGSSKKAYDEFCDLYYKILATNFDNSFEQVIS